MFWSFVVLGFFIGFFVLVFIREPEALPDWLTLAGGSWLGTIDYDEQPQGFVAYEISYPKPDRGDWPGL